MGALMTGALFGRTLALAFNKPAIGVHHMEGHMLAPLLSATPPAICGTTCIWWSYATDGGLWHWSVRTTW
jgi:hypothetical protein